MIYHSSMHVLTKLLVFIPAPLLINRKAISACPFAAARSNGVHPTWFIVHKSNGIIVNDWISDDDILY